MKTSTSLPIERIAAILLIALTAFAFTWIPSANVSVAGFDAGVTILDSGNYGYRYRIALADAGESLRSVRIDAEEDGTLLRECLVNRHDVGCTALGPSHWEVGPTLNRATYTWEAFGNFIGTCTDMLGVCRTDADILPGQESSAFAIQSAYPPRIQTAYLRGYAPSPLLYDGEEEVPGAACAVDVYCDAVKIRTLSPQNPASMLALAQALDKDLDEAFHLLHWILTKNAYDTFKRINEQVIDALQKNNSAAAKRIAERLADTAQRLAKSLTPEGLALVSLDASYVVAHLP